MTVRSRLDFQPPGIATCPPEQRGVARDRVKLLVARPDAVAHHRFDALPGVLNPGDLLVVNTSATRPAALDATMDGQPVVIHLAIERAPQRWVVEVRRADGTGPVPNASVRADIAVAGGATVKLQRPALDDRLWTADVTVPHGSVNDHATVHGRPITYGSGAQRWPLDAYQTIFAAHDTGAGSAEMASAARPFSRRLLTALVRRGVIVTPLTLHAGVSSPEVHEPPIEEWYDVPASTAALVTHTRRNGRRVIAVGTTVVRALETVACLGGTVRPGSGWTNLVLEPDRPTRAVDGLITGWHEAKASHLLLLEAVAGPDLVERAYTAALPAGYLWHEFGDSCLLLPNR